MEILDGYDFDLQVLASFSFSTPPLLVGSPTVLLAGVDEAGRGPLAGPVVAAAVILPDTPRLDGLRDSKIIPPEQREALYCEIQETALAIEVAVIEPTMIDSLNILGATMEAMRTCIRALLPIPQLVVIDGNSKPRSGITEHTVVRGDSQSAAVMAASVIAKVTRDQIMKEAHIEYPVYGFDEHKGYGCPKHLEAIAKYGPCPLHRRSFEPIKSLV